MIGGPEDGKAEGKLKFCIKVREVEYNVRNESTWKILALYRDFEGDLLTLKDTKKNTLRKH